MKLESIITVFLLLLSFFCKQSGGEIMYIANKTVDCVGVAPQKCLQVKFNNQDDWTSFYDKIEGFTYKPSFYYKLKVSKKTISNPPADASRIKYTLVEVLEKSASPIN